MEAIRLRASSLPELFDCPQRWAAKKLFGMRLPSSGNAALSLIIPFVFVGTLDGPKEQAAFAEAAKVVQAKAEMACNK